MPALTAQMNRFKPIPRHRTRFYTPIKQIVLELGGAFDRDGDVIELTGFPVRIFCFRHPEHIEAILKHPQVGDTKYVRMLPRVKWVMGRGGYILKGGSEWRERRRLVQTAFRRPCLVEYANQFPELTVRMLDHWKQYAASGAEFDICHELQSLIVRANFRMFFSAELTDEELESVRADTHFVELNFVRVSPLSLPLPGNIRFRRCVQRLRERMRNLVAARREEPERHQDLLSVLLRAQRDHGWSDDEVLGEIFSVYFGASVMSTSLAWALYLVAVHPEVQQRLGREVEDVLSGRSPAADDLASLRYTQMVLQETLRLYPPSWGYPRHCELGMDVDGHQIPPGAMVIPMVYHLHRHPEFWTDPERFIPERFSPDATIHPFSHLPFGGGPRICLGAQLAPMVMTLALATILQRFHLEFWPQSPADPIADFGFEIHPRHELRMVIRSA